MDNIIKLNSKLSDFLWGYPMIVVLLFGGLVLVYRSDFWVFKNFSYIFKNTFGRLVKDSKSDENSISPFEAVSTALAGTIGAGNIVGVATAIDFGGPGAIFWMWIASFVCMTTKMVEVSMAVASRVSDDDGKYIGGPMYYIEKGAGSKILAKIFSFFAFIAIIGTGALVQSNSISESLNAMTGLNLHLGGILIVIFMLLVVVGGIKRIGAFAAKIVPIMSVFYIIGCILILIFQIENLIPALKEIIICAFNPKSFASGAAGSGILISIRWGLARGIFSNEAGLGTAPMAHATSHTDHPIRQGMWGAIEVFVSSMIICTMTALVIITSGVYKIEKFEGAALTAASFSKSLFLGKYIVSLALVLFAFTTAVSWCYYGQRCVKYLTGSTKLSNIFKYIYIIFCYVGSIGGLKFAWTIADTANAFMVIPNILALIMMSKTFKKILDDFDKYKDSEKSGNYSWTYDNKWEKYFEK
ncbi:MAG: sodium:alanine symporter family protein [Anaerococcus vaginalis]|uniref:alanine/glycine:cation symporter family protein n=1 Tax=Anaerococcus jeddahensis TaxID=1673719 RepID=UPI00067261FF|nr:sodium:alanine symporter family protein [Anaerococcus jeddahensis]MDU5914264.1 sodium:alanine symporter family protein [Anaerococcus vaginalis]